MLFNSYAYIFIFLPATLILFHIAIRFSKDAGVVVLVIASLIFYSYWYVEHLPILMLLTLFNFGIGRAIEGRWASIRLLLLLGVGANLLALFIYKYLVFLLHQLQGFGAFPEVQIELVLPIGISFYVFTQIAYLVDVSRGIHGRYDLKRFVLFVTFFPHLLAGPILHHREMMPQFERGLVWRRYGRQVLTGVLIFSLGLFKKVCLADQVAPYANAAFNAADQGQALSFAAAWWGALAYTFQLYFDFSGYSDMAIGAALLFGIRLPINFNAPYRATSIIDFWRRWHMTLSRFLRDYLYIALGGNRLGRARRYVNLLLTMVLGGIWHGAGYGFLLWGLLHGLYLVVNHLWRAIRARWSAPASRTEIVAGWLLTFLAVVVGWVLFRATTLSGAGLMLQGMFGLNGFASPELWERVEAAWAMTQHLSTASIIAYALDLQRLDIPLHPALGAITGLLWLPLLFLLATFGPTSQHYVVSLVRATRSGRPARRVLASFAIMGIALLFIVAAARLNNVTEFLYFQF